jgi:hypothetical protein
MNRRTFIAASTSAAGLHSAARQPSYRVLYSNDTTNVMSCISPYHRKGQPFAPEMLEASVDEAAGVDVHLLQPGLGWIPWWKSKAYPAAEHYGWFQENTGLPADSVGRYLMNGGDIVKVFVDRCRLRGQAPFVSFRLNDVHHLEAAGTRTAAAASISKFYAQHPEYRIGTNQNKADQAVHNWAIPEVRAHKFAFIRELCEGYDLDGFELDFLRFWVLFRQSDTTPAERRRIVTDFVADVRKLLDRTSPKGKRRRLSVRIPSMVVGFEPLGIDLPAMVEAGVDIVNVSSSYFTQQQTDLPEIRRMAARAAVYLEMTHSAYNGPSRAKYDNFPFLRTTDQQFYTGAHLAYTQGADGVSLFNFVYFREHGGPGRGAFNEPPFHVLKHLGDRSYVARQPQWYVLAKMTQPPLPNRPLPFRFSAGQSQTFRLHLAPRPDAGPGLLRVMSIEDSPRQWSVRLNGRSLDPADYVPKPLPHPYDANLEIAGRFACFRIPQGLASTGANEVAATLLSPEAATVDYIDLAFG